MTDITEHRWKCDYCGKTSPILELEHGCIMTYRSPYEWVVMSGDAWKWPGERHFCTMLHAELWTQERMEATAA